MQSTYFFFFGGFPQLSLAELDQLLIPFKLTSQSLTPSLVQVSSLDQNQLETLKPRLGGTLKIAQLVANELTFEQLEPLLITEILASSAKNFALTNYVSNLSLASDFVSQLKRQLQSQKPVRFLSFQTQPHSLVALRKQHVVEFNLIPTQKNQSFALAKTIWIQNSDQWSQLDRQRPYQDIKRGMLPPKVARIMVNLATQGKSGGMLADPFCGTGTIALEAVLLGYQVFASDLDKKAVQGTQQNLEWLTQTLGLQSSFQVKTCDAVHLNQVIDRVDYIVTEPFMGSLLDQRKQLSPQQLKNNIKGLNKLYLGALKNWYSLLSDQGRVVMIFPEFHLFHKIWSVPLIDTCENLGYNKLAQLTYSKPQAKVVRQILILTKN